MKSVVLFIFIHLALFVSAKGQENNSEPLKLVIKANKNRVCYKESIDLTAKITNLSKNPVVIDTKQIGYMTDFSWWNPTSKGNAGGSITSIGESALFASYKPNFVILHPNDSYIEKAPTLLDNPAFLEVRNYNMKITYGQFMKTKFENVDVWRGAVKSNEINLFIRKCAVSRKYLKKGRL